VGQALMNRGERFVHEWNDSPWKASLSLTADGALMGLEGQALGFVTTRTLKFTSQFLIRRIPSEAWNLKPMDRGCLIEKIRGQNLPPAYKTMDKSRKTIGSWMINRSNKILPSDRFFLTSIKSLDPTTKIYQNSACFKRILKNYVDTAGVFQGQTRLKPKIKPENIQGRALELIIRPGSSNVQKQILKDMKKYAYTKNVTMKIIE